MKVVKLSRILLNIIIILLLILSVCTFIMGNFAEGIFYLFIAFLHHRVKVLEDELAICKKDIDNTYDAIVE